MKRTTRIIAIILVLAFAFSACTGSQPTTPAVTTAATQADATTATTAEEVKPAPPVELHMTVPGFATEALDPKSAIFVELQEKTNSVLKIDFIPDKSYGEKLSAMLAGNTLPDVCYIPSMTSSNIRMAAQSGAFWQLNDYLGRFENLSQYNPDTLMRASIEGRAYGLYRDRQIARLGNMQYRKDWAEKVGITEPPKTIEEFYDMCYKFTYGDPDGNNIDDTFAISAQSSMNSFPSILAWFGAGGGKNYTLRDGNIVHVATTEEYVEGLTFIRKLFEEGLINRDFISVSARNDNIRTGRAGIALGAVDDVLNNQKELVKLIPDAQLWVAGPVDAGKGLFAAPENDGFKGFFSFPKTTLKTEDQLMAALGVFDKMNTVEINDLIQYGIEGTHYNVKDGVVVRVEDMIQQRMKDSNDLNQLFTFNLTVNPATPEVKAPLDVAVDEVLATSLTYVQKTYNSGLLSPTDSKEGSELNKILDDAKAKFVMGQITEEQLRAETERWRAQGGDTIMKEFTEAYKAING